jgi:hypothetical protein
MDRNKNCVEEIAPVFYKLSLEVLFLVVVSAFGYTVVEFLLPGLLGRHISFFAVYATLLVSMLLVVVLGIFSRTTIAPRFLYGSEIFLISIASSLWITLSFDGLSFFLRVFLFFLIGLSFFSLSSFLFSQDESHE